MSKSYDLSSMTGEELKFLTKRITTYNNTLIDINELQHRIPLAKASFHGPKTAYHVGNLDKLSLEILHEIVARMDVFSVLALRKTNSHLKAVVESLPGVQQVMKEARPVMRALIATGGSCLWKIGDITRVMYSTQCEFCGEHGEIMNLLKMKRCCFKCVTTERELLAVDPEYVMKTMGLTKMETQSLPQIATIPQKHFWGHPKAVSYAIDYSSAVEMATKKYNEGYRPIVSSKQDQSMVNFNGKRTGEHLEEPCQSKTKRCKLSIKPLHTRRKSGDAKKITPLPLFLLHPPETQYLQHASSLYLPALQRIPGHQARPVQALLCAGCSYYFNYHSHLPFQTHTLYPHDSVSSKIRKGKPLTPLQEHLTNCNFAKIYWLNLYPEWHDTTLPFNPALKENGGICTKEELIQKAVEHRIKELDPKTAKTRHYKRHFDTSGCTSQDMWLNNELFESIPELMMKASVKMNKVKRVTALELELQAIKEKKHSTPPLSASSSAPDHSTHDIRKALNPTHDLDTFTPTQRARIATVAKLSTNNASNDDDNYDEDHYADALLGSTDTISQASWATARPSHANALFRGWVGLYEERKKHHEYQSARDTKKKPGSVKARAWGLDRFGCVSDLC